jgi:hypothetical protein
MFYIKFLSTFEPSGVIGVDRKACQHMYLLMNFLGPDPNVRKCTVLVKKPTIDVVSLMQLV